MKFYIGQRWNKKDICIIQAMLLEFSGEAQWCVIERRGKNGSNLQSNLKTLYYNSTAGMQAALNEARRTFNNVLKKYEYEDITNGWSYIVDQKWLTDTLNEIESLGADSGTGLNDEELLNDSEKEPKSSFDAIPMKCINDIGMTDNFEKGGKYDTKFHSDKDLLWACDANGEWHECFKERFEGV